jgi:hypothetical protein
MSALIRHLPRAARHAAVRLPLLAAWAATTLGCNGGNDGSGPIDIVDPISVVLTPGGSRTLAIGDTLRISAAVNGGDNAARTVTWSSSAGGVAAVTAVAGDGNPATITAVGRGTTTIRATSTADPNRRSDLLVTVTGLAVTLNPGAAQTLDVGRTLGVIASVTGGAPTLPKQVTWSSSAPAVLSVTTINDTTARLGGVAVGTVTLTARASRDQQAVASLTVTVRAVTAAFPTWTRTVIGGGMTALASVSLPSATVAWVGDSTTRVWRWSEGAWAQAQTTPAGGTGAIVRALDDARSWTWYTLQGGRGFVYQRLAPADSFVTIPRPPTERYNAIAVRPGTAQVYAVGDSGKLAFLSPQAQDVREFAGFPRMNALWFASNALGYAAGAGPVLARFDNGVWSPATLPPGLTGALDTRVWGSGPTDVHLGAVIAGELRVFRFDGTRWSTSPVLVLPGFTVGEWDAAVLGPTEWYVTGRPGIWRINSTAPALQVFAGTASQFATRIAIAPDGGLAMAVGPAGQVFTAPRATP